MLGGTPLAGYYTQPGMITVLVIPRSVLSPPLLHLAQFSPAWLCWDTMLGGTPPTGYYTQPGMITVLVIPCSVPSPPLYTSLRGRPRSALPCLVVLGYDARWYATNGLLHTTWYDYCPGYTSLCSITSFVTLRYEVDLVQFSLAWLC